MIRKFVQRLYAGCIIAMAWSVITCSLVGAWTIYSHASDIISPRRVERVEVPVIIPQGWSEPPSAPIPAPKKAR